MLQRRQARDVLVADPVSLRAELGDGGIWSRQREIVDAVPGHKRIAVPAGFGVGKTWIAGRLVAWAGAVNAPGTMVIVTTATRFRQVRNQLWPHIRKTVARAGLPGYCDTTQWKIPDQWGNDVIVAYGFTAPENDEAAMQGIHGTPKLLIVVDEAGGIARTIGNGTNNLLTGDARMLAIGNPAMDDPRSWFEGLCEEGEDPEEPSTITIPIATFASPAITKERVPYCNDCPDGVPPHSLAIHLPDQDWVDRTIRDASVEPEESRRSHKDVALTRRDGGSGCAGWRTAVSGTRRSVRRVHSRAGRAGQRRCGAAVSDRRQEAGGSDAG